MCLTDSPCASQIYDYVRHFMTACSSVLGTDVNVESTYILDAHQRTAVTVDAFPVGINYARFEVGGVSLLLDPRLD